MWHFRLSSPHLLDVCFFTRMTDLPTIQRMVTPYLLLPLGNILWEAIEEQENTRSG